VQQFTTIIALIGIVIIVASLLSSALARSGVPLPAAFLLLGAVLGPVGLGLIDVGLDSPTLRALATLALALVLFSDAVTIELADLRRHSRLLVWLLGPGTILPAAVTGIAGWLLLDLSPPAAALLGAALSSTDAILLRRVLRSRVLPATAQVALRLETGMNDLVLLPIVVLAMMLLASGGTVTGTDLARSALRLFLVGPAIGALVGWLGVTALVRVRSRGGVRRDYEALYALALAFLAYAAAEGLGASGFLAAFAAGLTVSAQDVELCDCFLEYGEATSLMLVLLTYVAFGTSLIWTGLQVLDARTLLFAGVALTARTVVLFPLLAAAGVPGRDRWLTALLGPRGITSLLLILLPVFAGVPGAQRLFSVTCLVVLLSILVHGTGLALLLRAHAPPVSRAAAEDASAPPVADEGPPASPAASVADVPERITIDELRALRARGEPVVIVDARTERSYQAERTRARGAIRLPPDDPVGAATALRLAHHATLVVYCA
jgi:NhaP-type Na+/H+ or K+/H+ antiporter